MSIISDFEETLKQATTMRRHGTTWNDKRAAFLMPAQLTGEDAAVGPCQLVYRQAGDVGNTVVNEYLSAADGLFIIVKTEPQR